MLTIRWSTTNVKKVGKHTVEVKSNCTTEKHQEDASYEMKDTFSQTVEMKVIKKGSCGTMQRKSTMKKRPTVYNEKKCRGQRPIEENPTRVY